MAEPTYDLIVVGAGVVGAATAWAAARAGHSVLLLERGEFGHAEGSSCGESRITRLTYPEEHYASIMPRCFDLWRLAQETGDDHDIMVTTGGLDFGPIGDKGFQSLLDTCAACGVAVEHLDARTLPERVPGMRLPAGERCVYSAESGILRASRCVAALRRLAVRAGAVERDRAAVLAVREGAQSRGNIAEVETVDGTHRARAVVLACGGWVPAILERDFGLRIPDRRLHPYATGVAYWKLSPEWEGRLNAANLGPVIDYNPGADVYGMGALEHPGWFKMCLHVDYTDDCAIESMDNFEQRFGKGGTGEIFKAKTQEIVAPWLQRHFQEGVFEEPLTICHFEPCVYTMTPDEDYVIDALGCAEAGAGRVVLVSSCSGHGFKTAPVTGAAAAALALKGAKAASSELLLESPERMQELFGLRRLLKGDPGGGMSPLRLASEQKQAKL